MKPAIDPTAILQMEKPEVTRWASGEICYVVTIGPGNLRYLTVDNLMRCEADSLIQAIRNLALDTQVKIALNPYDATQLGYPAHAEECFPDQKWEEELKTHQRFAVISRQKGVSSWAYRCFHLGLNLKAFEGDQCSEAWVKEAWGNSDMQKSFVSSQDHIILPFDAGEDEPLCVFRKTSFVLGRLSALEQEDQRRRGDIDAQKAIAEAETLRRSRFSTYVYLMQDLRNGLFKIGQSKTPAKRERTLQSEVPQIVMRLSIPAGDGCEKQLHERFMNKKVRGEWFELAADDVLWIVAFLKQTADIARAKVDHQWLGTVYFSAGSGQAPK